MLDKMTWISKATSAFGMLLLAHACYSAHEHSALQAYRTASTSTVQSGAAASLPIDITIETLVATLVISIGLVLGTSTLRPIQWRVWAGQIEREGESGFKDSNGDVDKAYIGNPFKLLESRPGFVDIRKQRKEFTDWVKAK